MSSESAGPRRRPALFVLVAVVIAAVAAGVVAVVAGRVVVAGAPVAGGQPTVWQRIDAGADGGTPTAETALAAFSYLFGAVPGVAAPAGRPDPDGFAVSGSGPLRWVLGHWAELTPEQQRAVAAVVTPPDGPPRLRQDDKDRAAPAIRAELDRLVTDIGGRLGASLPEPKLYLVDIERTAESGGPVRAWSMALADGESIAPDGDGPLLTTTGGAATSCSVYVPPSLWRGAAGGVSADARATLAHEIVHCYQGFGYPDLARFRSAPAWVVEGGAEFGGTDVAGKAAGTPSNWFYYLAQQAPLFDRTYSAMGWWFHLQHVGHDPWRAFPAIWAGAQDNVTAYSTAGGDFDDVYDTWGASLLRQPGFGDAWQVHGVDVGTDMPPREKLAAEGGSLTVAAFDARAAEVAVGSPVGGAEQVVLVTANQPVRVHDNGGFEDVHITEGDYCVGARCVCPEGTERAGAEIQRVEPSLWLGVSGGEAGTSVTTDTMTIEDYCRKKPERRSPDAPSGPPGTRPHAPPTNPNSGTPQETPPAGSNGDPHLTTFDGHSYDFQAGGEFTLARAESTDAADGLEIQARQEAYRRPDGSEDTSVSINTAVAANVAGDRVTIAVADGRPELRVEGDRVAPRAEQALPGGGAVAPEGGGYTVRWPDDTTLWVVPVGDHGLNVAVRPAAGRKGKLHGLLGPFAGDLGSPVMEDRAGKRYPSVTTRQLYDEVGKSWRVSAGASLFDYAPGTSAATYVRADMPGPPPLPTPEQRAAADAACAGVTGERLRAQCAFDIAVTGDDAFVSGYEAVGELVVVGGGDVEPGERVGPEHLEPGQQKTFTIGGDATALQFVTDVACADAATVFWRVTAPDGTESLLVSMCADVGRVSSAKAGTWRVEVSVDPGAGEGGTFAFRALEAGGQRTTGISLPATKEGTISGPGAEHRYTFDGLAGDEVTVEATEDCAATGELQWGLADPNGFVVTLRTPACEDLGTQTLTGDGRWSIVVTNPGSDDEEHRYGFTARRG